MAKVMKVGVTRTIGFGGPLDGLLSSRFIVAFFACGLVLVSRGLIFGLVTVNYGNAPVGNGRIDPADLVNAGTIERVLPPSTRTRIDREPVEPVDTGRSYNKYTSFFWIF